jgi:hypothetical protein
VWTIELHALSCDPLRVTQIIREQIHMTDQKLARPPVHECPVCHFPQTKIQRRVGAAKHGSTNYVCSRAEDCVLGINLTQVDTWVAV